jgi:hypothetical protein
MRPQSKICCSSTPSYNPFQAQLHFPRQENLLPTLLTCPPKHFDELKNTHKYNQAKWVGLHNPLSATSHHFFKENERVTGTTKVWEITFTMSLPKYKQFIEISRTAILGFTAKLGTRKIR